MSNSVDLRELAIDRGATGQANLRARRNVLTRYVLPLVLIAGFLSLVAWASRDFLFPPKAVAVMPVFSTTAEVRQEGTPLFQAAGWIEPRPTPVRVAALAPGVVEKLLVVEDQPVKAGEPVAELVKDDAKLTLDAASADLKLRDAELDEARSLLTAAETRLKQPVHLEAALGEADASLAKVQTQLKSLPFEIRGAVADQEAAQQDYEGKVAAKGVVAGVAIDIAKGKAEAATARVDELRDREGSLKKEQAALTGRRDALKTQLILLADELKERDGALAKVKAATARVEQTQVVVAEAQLRLDRMTVVSPIDGRVFRLIAHQGARIGGGMTQMTGHDGSTVVTMYRPSMLQVRVDVRFEDIPKVSLHQPVEIDNPALSSPLTGKVLFISSEADIQKNTLQVKVAIPDPPPVFKPEMLVDVTFLAPKQSNRTTEPSQELKLYVLGQLIHQGEGGSFVWLADQSEGVARKTTIQTGAVGSNGLVEITSGLTVSSRIISSGIDGLQDGDRITVTEEGQEPTAQSQENGEADSQDSKAEQLKRRSGS
ncbi:MAG: HlyD family efflux transporter periplasmic adaptor subunit [Planctomycetaceae bacterium]|jgi:HlyD family secretion protein|nr:HlyD family efflux transporter periplasmic adaptor subunit [Planctomycetaceae bacterium]MBT6487223.1 HlyD family efflux transporter periplasmic adaptor subunit [Planctomycetaceae bacterium]MBT6495153.1 HlyD family efflux transporter periplasmic adaptor subunit [Planctomycetaceae bacterium]